MREEMMVATKITGKNSVKKKSNSRVVIVEEEVDYSLNDVLLRGRVSAEATTKEMPSGDKVVEFRLIVSREHREGVDTLDIGAWSAKSRKAALSLKSEEWIEIVGSIHRRFWQSPTGVASRWQIEAAEIVRL
ncbi:MAG: single-stranded DNA-binding protein [Actinobacteria bacterium]|jgi:single-strand DNA-binding protein|nr:single-stranded DNA-binding protein [Actinomycetota bacterium]